MSRDLEALDLACRLVERSTALGANEVSIGVSEGTSAEIIRRDRKVEHASESRTRRVEVSLLVDDRYSSHSTSDLRDEALDLFLRRAIEATRYLEPDPDRALPSRELCGRGATDVELDMLDPGYASWTADDRAAAAAAIEEAVLRRVGDHFVSGTAWASDGSGRSAVATSHGFADASDGAWFSFGAEATLSEPGGRRPEGHAAFSARYRSDLPDPDAIAAEAFARAHEAVGAAPAPSGRYPMVLSNRAVGRLLSALYGPLGGYAIHHGRSCLADQLGQAIASPLLTLVDDPTIPRGLGSEAWDGDLLIARPRTVIEAGVLQLHYLDVYHARKLGRPPTAAGKGNWVVTPGERSWVDAVRAAPRAILVTGFLGGNSNGLTGDFSLGVRGRLLEHGEPTATLAEMNVSGNLKTFFRQLIAVGDDPWRWSSMRAPTLVFDDVAFSGT
jgi:PmbA protein